MGIKLTYQTFRYNWYSFAKYRDKSHSENFELTYYNRNLKPIDAIKEYLGIMLFDQSKVLCNNKNRARIKLDGNLAEINIICKEIELT